MRAAHGTRGRHVTYAMCGVPGMPGMPDMHVLAVLAVLAVCGCSGCLRLFAPVLAVLRLFYIKT